MLISSFSFGQILTNNTSCDIYIRGSLSGCVTPFGPICVAPGASTGVAGVEALTIHYQCSPECGLGLSVGKPGNCAGYFPGTTINTGSCCATSTLSATYTAATGDWDITP